MINCLAAEGRKSHDNSNLNPDIGVRFQAACGSTVTLPRNQMENKAFIRPRPIFSIVAIMFSLSLSQGCATFASGPSNEERLSVCADRLVSYSDWSEAEGQAWHLDIHVSNGGRLHYFGAVHSSDPKHPQMAEIEERWNQVEPTLAFYEGPNRGIGADAFETISKYGESGYTRYLADQAGIPSRRLNPPPADYLRHLLDRFPSEQVSLFLFLGEASRLRRKGATRLEAEFGVLELMKRASAIPHSEHLLKELASLEEAYQRYWTEPEDWRDVPKVWFNPGDDPKVTGGIFTNTINRVSSEYRNRFMFEQLSNAALEGERIFAVVGRNHIPMQAPALKCMLQLPEERRLP